MNTPPPSAESLRHHFRRMIGRDPHESHRTATPLELLFDLTFVLAFGFAASQYAHALSEGHFSTGLIGFAFASFGICWAWINFSWFASAYDTDDWIYRICTMIQMIGVLILANGLPRMFASIDAGGPLDIHTLVLGYIVMRVAMLFQWLRAAKQDPGRKQICLTYAASISIAQFGWIGLAFLQIPLPPFIACICLLCIVEMAGPYLAERIGDGTPWHAHHISERYGLFTIIALGEGVIGTIATLNSVVEKSGWNLDAFLVSTAGIGLTFGMWWIYYMLPAATVLHNHRERAFVWGYGQMAVVASIVATGAGLHTAADFIEHKSHIGPLQTLLSVAIPLSTFILLIYGMYYYLVRSFDKFHIWLVSGTTAIVALAITLAANGVSMTTCLIVLMLAPVVTVVGYEVRGHLHQAEALANDAQSII